MTQIKHPDVRSLSKGEMLHVQQTVFAKYLQTCYFIENKMTND